MAISNLETGAEGEVIRTSPTGRFDGFLRLTEGRNTIRVEVALVGGTTVREQRVVIYEPGRGEGEEARQAEADLEKQIRVRRLRLEYWAEMERVRKARRRTVMIRPESAEEEAARQRAE